MIVTPTQVEYNTSSNYCGQSYTKLEQMLINAPTETFPQNKQSLSGNTCSYNERYFLLKKHLGEKQEQVENGALLASARKNCSYDDLVFLNHHGKSHIEDVMNRAAELIEFINTNSLSGFELFLLLCAIQIHDIGNLTGRENHTTSFRPDFLKISKESCFIKEPGLGEMIFEIAAVHGGSIEGDKDTINRLSARKELLGCEVRPQFLAAILRFSDELSDDFTRAKEIDNIPKESGIFHAYSKTLHPPKISKIDNSDMCCVKLRYFFERNEALREYTVNGKKKMLLNEIFDRTKKMEKERRYCSRYLMPYILISMIDIKLEIKFPNEFSARPYEYTLKERGYPDANIKFKEQSIIVNEVCGLSRNNKCTFKLPWNKGGINE